MGAFHIPQITLLDAKPSEKKVAEIVNEKAIFL